MMFSTCKNMRRMAALVVLCLLTSFLCACSGSKRFRKRIDAPELARIIVDSMQDITVSEELFKQIPDEQKDGITYSEYYEYITVLQQMMPRSGIATSFSIVEGDEKKELLKQMLNSDSEEYVQLINSCIPVRIETSGFRRSDKPIYIYLQTKEDGTVYLNHRWISDCMDLSAFSVHYFEAYANENQTDVERLLHSMEVKDVLPQSETIQEAKAKELIRFYSVNIKSEWDEFEVVSVDASNMVFLQPEVLDANLHASSREVRFSSNADNVISVSDSIESELKTTDLYLYYNSHRTIRVGDHTTASSMIMLFGEPISVTCGPVLEGGSVNQNRADGKRNILIRYPGFTITVYGTFTSEEEWEGNCTRFRIWDNSKASIGEHVSTTLTSWDVLERYPFADESGFVLNVTVDGETYELTVELDQTHKNGDGSYPISSLRLSKVK